MTSSQIILICKSTRFFSFDQIFSISQTTESFHNAAIEITSKENLTSKNYMNFFT